jgi:probable rRNA maturation factor
MKIIQKINLEEKILTKDKEGGCMELIIDNRQEKINISDELIKQMEEVVLECLRYEEYDEGYEVSLSFVDNEEIHKLNKEYRSVDRATDVLSFPLIDDEFDFQIDIEEKILGDIVISLEKALEQSEEYKHSFEREVCFLVCHSMFHLMGYDHDNDENTKEMRKKEEAVLNKLGIIRE